MDLPTLLKEKLVLLTILCRLLLEDGINQQRRDHNDRHRGEEVAPVIVVVLLVNMSASPWAYMKDWSFDIQITAEEAGHKVTDWLLDQVSTTIGASEPMLVVDRGTVVWRVPAIFTA